MHLCLIRKLLTLPVPCISESCIEIKIKLNFYFRTSLWCLKTKFNLIFALRPDLGRRVNNTKNLLTTYPHIQSISLDLSKH